MSTWTSDRPGNALLLALSLLLALAGCFETDALSRVLPGSASMGPGAIGVLDGALTVAGPDGYCIDEAATRESGQNAFVLLRRCRGNRGPVLSVTVTDLRVPPGDRTEQLDGLAAFLSTESGRGQLSRRGRASDVSIDEISLQDGALWLYLTDLGNPEAFQPGYWRAILPLTGRLVTLSAMSLDGAPNDRASGRRAMEALIVTLRQRNLD